MSARSLLAITLLALGCGTGTAMPDTPDASDAGVDEPLDVFVPKQLAVARVPGVSVAIIKGGKIVYAHAWGLMHESPDVPMTTDTIFLCASVSKPFVGVSILQLVEQGKLALDDDINAYLPIALRNPRFPDVPIAVRMLLSHASSISEGYVQLFGEIKPGDSPESLESFLRRWMLPDGDHWASGSNWSSSKPGSKTVYSQVGVVALALALERITGQSYADYVKANVLAPLDMRDASLRLADYSDKARLATPYVWASLSDNPLEHWGAPFYPAATLHATTRDLARFLLAMQGGGALDGKRVLRAESVTLMQQISYPALDANRGLLWLYRDVGGQRVGGHYGGAPGVSTTMFYRPSDNVGVVTLTNADLHIRVALGREEQLSAFRSIEERLFREAAKY